VLLAFEPDAAGYLRIGLETMARLHPGAEVHLLAAKSDISRETFPRVSRLYGYSRSEKGRLEAPELGRSKEGSRRERRYDLTLLFVQNPDDPIVRELLRLVKSVRSRKRLVVDCNFNAYRGNGYWLSRLRGFAVRLPHMLKEPRMLLTQFGVAASLLKRRILMRHGRWERWEATGAGSVQEDE
jgi:hypothetical protein